MNAGRFMCDAFYIAPPADSDEYIQFIDNLCEEENIGVFIPIIDSGLLKVSSNLDKISNTTVIISPYDTIKKCDNKALTYKMFCDADIKTPKIYGSISDITDTDFPLFVKPLEGGRASLGCRRVDSIDELNITLRNSAVPLLICEYIDGQEYTTDVICTMSGEYVAGLPRKRVETKSGVSYKSEIVYNETILLEAKKLVKCVDFYGPLNIQCIEDANGDFYFIEVNPRFSGTLSATIGAGLNTVEILLASIYNEGMVTSNNYTYTEGYMLRYWSDVFVPKSYFGA
jgi:carbamoyl-phosphate synthase large subunit